MDPDIRPDAEKSRRALASQIRESFGRLVYSHKTHEKTADIYSGRLTQIKITQIALSALVTGGLLLILFGKPDQSKVAAIISAFVSTILLAINTYTKDFDLGQLAQRHRETAADLWRVREAYLSLIADLAGESKSLREIAADRDSLQDQLASIYTGAPRTLPAAYKRAGLALKTEEEFTFSDSEIDRFLPPGLRSGNSQKGSKDTEGGAAGGKQSNDS